MSSMARIFFDGGESGACDMWDAASMPTIKTSTPSPFDGNYCFTGPGTKGGFSFQEVYVAFRWYCTSSAAQHIFQFTVSGAAVASVTKNSSAYVEFRVGASTIVATSTEPVSLNAWHLVEIYYYAEQSGTDGGRCTVKVDGVQFVDYKGDSTSGAVTITGIQLGATSASIYDNLVMDDSEWVGDTRIQGLAVDAQGSVDEWVPTTTDMNYDCVSEVPYSDADYVYTNEVNKTDLYGLANLTGVIDSVKAVQVQARAVKTGSPTPQKIDLVVKSGATTDLSADKTVATSAGSLCAVWNTDPAGGAWSESGVNAIEVGVKSKA
jgi:hypothetical protein